MIRLDAYAKINLSLRVLANISKNACGVSTRPSASSLAPGISVLPISNSCARALAAMLRSPMLAAVMKVPMGVWAPPTALSKPVIRAPSGGCWFSRNSF